MNKMNLDGTNDIAACVTPAPISLIDSIKNRTTDLIGSMATMQADYAIQHEHMEEKEFNSMSAKKFRLIDKAKEYYELALMYAEAAAAC